MCDGMGNGCFTCAARVLLPPTLVFIGEKRFRRAVYERNAAGVAGAAAAAAADKRDRQAFTLTK